MEERQCLVFSRMGRVRLPEEILEQRPEEGEGARGRNASRRLLCPEKREQGDGQRRNPASDPVRACGPCEDMSI